MTMPIKWLPLIILLIALSRAEAQTTINAVSCSAADVQKALNAVVADGTTVNIPAGNCTWTTSVTYNQAFSTTIQGQTTCSGTPASSCTDTTVITDGLSTRTTSNDPGTFILNAAAGKSLRITGLTFAYGASEPSTFQGTIRVSGNSQAVRFDHIHFNNISVVTMQVDGWVYGLMDHILWQQGGNNWNGVRVRHSAWGGQSFGDGSWADNSYFGTNKFWVVEDSTINNGIVNDCSGGGRWVIRHNVLNNASVQSHGTGHGFRDRGCRAQEFYANVLGNVPDPANNPAFDAFFDANGTALIWGNSAPIGYQSFATIHINREDNLTYTQAAPPNGWGYCGTAVNGAGSNWDQNANAVTGYACLDQIGRGKGDSLANDFPNAVNTVTGTIAWPHQAVEPVYEWLNTWNPVPGWPSTFWNVYDDGAQANRDYYLYTPGFNGTSGTGSGLLSARPSTCTPMVAYWATDTNTLYQCSSTNTWTVYYKPYTYPHPLTGSSGSATAPSAPSGLQAVVN